MGFSTSAEDYFAQESPIFLGEEFGKTGRLFPSFARANPDDGRFCAISKPILMLQGEVLARGLHIW